MLTTRLIVECPSCHTQYLMKERPFHYSNGAYIENVAGAPEWQRLVCPCRPRNPYKFKVGEKKRLQVVSEDDSERTHFLTRTNKGKP
jgi:hypothetical protein